MRQFTQMIFLSALVLLPLNAHGQFVLPGDMDYWTKTSPWIQYIYPREHSGVLSELDHYMQFFRNKYDRSFTWSLDERIKLILASSQNQVANGFATVIPFLETAHFPSGFELLDLFAEDSFLFALTSHETAHLYQLSAKSSLSSAVKSILGNTPVVMTPIGLPIWVFPNAFLPNFMLEGNAVMNESTIGRGGRLWSGEVRAEVFASARAGKTGANRLINFNVDYPLSEHYHYGGYFFAYLAERYGVDKTNQFYVSHARREFWPFLLNKSFREHFGTSYTRLIHDFDEQWLKPKAALQQQAMGQVVGRSFGRPRFNSSDQYIDFVANPTGRLSNELFRLNRTDATLKQQKTDLPAGKVFHLDGHFYTVDADRIDATHIKYALFGEGLAPKPGTEGLIYQDVRGGQTLVVDAATSYAHASLMKNGQFLDHTATSAVLDSQGKAYYFRQAGQEHVLYRDREPVFKYKGYYGIPTEVTADGAIYFIASTPYGSSLFRWRSGQFERMFRADNVVEARFVKDNLFLVAATDGNGHQIQLLHAEAHPESPAWFDYKLPNEMPPLPKADNAIGNLATTALAQPEQSYSALGQMRYSSANVGYTNNSLLLDITLADPLLWNTLFLSGEFGPEDNGGMISYSNQRHRLGWGFTALFQSDELERPDESTYRKNEAQAFLDLRYELFKWRRWSSSLLVAPSWAEENSLTNRELQRRYGLFSGLSLYYQRQDGTLGYQPYRHFFVEVFNRTEASARTDRRIDSASGMQIGLGGDIYRQTFFSAMGAWAVAEQNSLGVNFLKDHRGPARPFMLPTYLADADAKEVREWSATLKQVVDWSYYFPRFPLSLTRLAPFVSFKDTYTKERGQVNEVPSWRQELTFGTDLELLVIHNGLARVTPTFSAIKLGARTEEAWGVNVAFSRNF